MLKPEFVDGGPHWLSTMPEEVHPAFEDFRNFLFLVWSHLGLPEPTKAQYEIAHRLQYGVDSSQKRRAASSSDQRYPGVHEDGLLVTRGH